MIKDTIIYKNQTILTIYHEGFEDEKSTIKRNISQHVGKCVLRFKEEYVPDTEWDALNGFAWEEKALVSPKEKYNPYSERCCARMLHRIYRNKPFAIWKESGNTVSGKELVEIISFVKTYTGMNLEEKPIYFGDVFLFSPSIIEYRSNKENSVIISNVKKGMRIILHLKKGDSVVQSTMHDITEDSDCLEVKAECDWNNHDIEVFENGKLIYINRNISYMRHMQFSISVGGRKKRIPLKTLNDYEVEIKGKPQVSSIGEPPEPVQKMLGECNQELVLSLQKQKGSETFQFYQPGEVEQAKQKIMKMMESAADELWIFDSYFTDKRSGSDVMIDWLRMSMTTKAQRKNIIFCCKDVSNALDVTGLKMEILRDEILQLLIDERKILGVKLVQTVAPIHDRFLIVRNGDTYEGLAIGTSFNSLNSNHYCIQKIAHREAEEIISMLAEWVKCNTVESGEI